MTTTTTEATEKKAAKPAPKMNTKKGLHQLADELVNRVRQIANGERGDADDEAPEEPALSEDEARPLVMAFIRRNAEEWATQIAAKLS